MGSDTLIAGQDVEQHLTCGSRHSGQSEDDGDAASQGLKKSFDPMRSLTARTELILEAAKTSNVAAATEQIAEPDGHG